MGKELQPYTLEGCKQAHVSTRRDFFMSMGWMGLGGLLAAVGLVDSNRRLEETNELGTALMALKIKDPGSVQAAEDLKLEVERRNFIRDRLDPALIFGGGFMVLRGVFRLLKFM